MRNISIKLKKNKLEKNVLIFMFRYRELGYCYCFSHLLSFLSLYQVSPRSAFMARISPWGIVILNSFPRHFFSRASLSILPIARSSSFSWLFSAPPLTADLATANSVVLFVAVLWLTVSVDFLGRVLFTNSSGLKIDDLLYYYYYYYCCYYYDCCYYYHHHHYYLPGLLF